MKLLLPKVDAAFRRKALELLGFNGDDVLELPPKSIVQAPEVYVPATAEIAGERLAPRPMRRVRDAIARPRPGRGGGCMPRASPSGGGGVTNERDLRASTLERFGFEP